MGQRFRRYDNASQYDDFTLRVWNYVTGSDVEFKKVITALENDRHVSHYYAYGHVNKLEDGFLRFRIINFPKFLKKYINNRFLPDKKIPTKEGDAEFLCWSFRRIPRDLFIYDSTKILTLDRYLKE